MTKKAPASVLDMPDALIAEAAYFKAEQRGFVPGHEVDDWLAAEREVEAMLSGLAKRVKKKAPRATTVAAKGPRASPKKNGAGATTKAAKKKAAKKAAKK